MGKKRALLWEGKMWVPIRKGKVVKDRGLPLLCATKKIAEIWSRIGDIGTHVRVIIELDE